jgi:glycosyltransferase involved in cell wall biosynthesis
VALAWLRFGPYHHARAAAARAALPLVTLELSPVDKVNYWDIISSDHDDHHVVSTEDPCRLDMTQLRVRSWAILDRLEPSVLAVPGWGHRWARILHAWALARSVPTVVMSASNSHDGARNRWVEGLKRQVVSRFDAGLVGGREGARYLESLGIPASRIAVGYDAVDNAHFSHPSASAVDLVRKQAPRVPFFLASARFVEKKNLLRLVEAYRRYRDLTEEAPWDLVLLGDGPLRQSILERCTRLDLGDCVHLPGFRQYAELPAWYSQAKCFVLPSTSEQWGLVVNEAMAAGLPVLVSAQCGCAPDLVRPGVNGFTFDPRAPERLARLMLRVAHGDVDGAAMGRASREVVADWGVDRFAQGLTQAVDAALAAPPRRTSMMKRIICQALVHR